MPKKGNFAIMMSAAYLKAIDFIRDCPKTLESARQKTGAFTRNRGMSFCQAIAFMLDMGKTTLQTRLNLFFDKTEGGEPISQQAFSKLRMNFDHSPFEKMVRVTVAEEYKGIYDKPMFCGYHIFAVDGSYLQLPRVDALREEFGIRGGGTQPSAGVSILYDVLQGWVIDPIITHTDMNERTECSKHIDFLRNELPYTADNAIFTIDRGYPSIALFEKFTNCNIKFVARCSTASMPQIVNAPMGDSIVTLKTEWLCVSTSSSSLQEKLKPLQPTCLTLTQTTFRSFMLCDGV